jgi:DNA-binding MarR family transcriptional regulator
MFGIPKEELRDLQLLSEIEKSSHLNQRILAKKLGIALGLTNLCIKRLVKKGYVEVANIDNRRLKYIITPTGIAEKSRLTYEYFKATVSFYKRFRGVIVRVFKRIRDDGHKRVVFFGGGEEAEIAYISLHQTDLSLEAVVDEKMTGTSLFGHPVLPLKELPNLNYDVVVVVSFDKGQERRQALMDMNVEPDRIVLMGDG